MKTPHKILDTEEIIDQFTSSVDIVKASTVFIKLHVANSYFRSLGTDVALTSSLNERLQKRKMPVIEINYNIATGQAAIVKVYEDTLYVDKERLSSYLK